MSWHYNRNQHISPESYQGKISTAWLEHNQRFRPKLQQWQDLVASTAYKLKKKGKFQRVLAKHNITTATSDYILLSMSSFMQYLTEYCAYFTVMKFETEGYKITSKDVADLNAFIAVNAKIALVKSLIDETKTKSSDDRKNRKNIHKTKSARTNKSRVHRKHQPSKHNDGLHDINPKYPERELSDNERDADTTNQNH